MSAGAARGKELAPPPGEPPRDLAPKKKKVSLKEYLAGAETQEEREKLLAKLPRETQERIFLQLRAKMSDSERRKLDAVVDAAIQNYAPETDDELHAFVIKECGMNVPRKSVCAGHCAPFDLMSDIYFERGNLNKMAIGNRGSGKTRILGTLHGVLARTKPKYQSATAGATLAQSNRCYTYFRKIMERPGWMKFTKRGRVNQGGTEFRNDATVEVVTGTLTGVNSPHPHMAHLDEVELLREGVYEEALNMAQSSDGHAAQNVLTSSWKLVRGLVTRIVEQVEEAERAGRPTPYQLYRWCAFETSVPCPHDCDSCPFADVVKGKWEDGSPRSFESVCKRHSPEAGVGRLKFSEGFVPMNDLLSRFVSLPRRTWDAQQESRRPTAEGLVYYMFDEQDMTVASWDPDPELGDWFLTVDFGGTVPHAIGFWQGPTRHEVEIDGKRVPVGSYVLFDEVYELGGNVEVAIQVVARLDTWATQYPQVYGKWQKKAPTIFGDPAAKAARADWSNLRGLGAADIDLPVTCVGNQPVMDGISLVQGMMEDNLIFVDRVRCDNWLMEQGAYEMDEVTGKPKKENDHFMDSMRYGMWNLHVRERNNRPSGNVIPMAIERNRAIQHNREQGWEWDPGDGSTRPEQQGPRPKRHKSVAGARVHGPVASIDRYRDSPG